MPDYNIVIVLAIALLGSALAYAAGKRQRLAPAPSNAKPEPAPIASALATVPAASAPPAKALPVLERLVYEEDSDIDPTRVGAGLSKAPERLLYQPPLKRIAYDEDAEINEPTSSQKLFLVHAAAQTDVGLKRKRNEDSLLVMPDESLFVIADGMGGYKGGDLASNLAVTTIRTAFEQRTFLGAPHDDVPVDATNLARAIQMANAAILEAASRAPELEGMGTTVCAARFSPGKRRLFIAHVGDSRCYRLRASKLMQMTADHTMADLGVTGPQAGALSRAVGIWPTMPIDIVSAVPEAGDAYLLCSDGLTKMLDDGAIAALLENLEDPQAAVERLIAAANANGGKDNVTVILVCVLSPSARAAPSPSGKST